MTKHLFFNDGVRRAGDSLRSDSIVQRFVSRPSSPRRILWDALSVLVMGYDLVFIPLQVFETDDAVDAVLPYYEISLLTTLFWSMDLGISFFAGYHKGGLIEMRPKQVAWHYLTTWFPIDIVLATIDWVVISFDSSQLEGLGLMRLNKTLRIVRVLRVLRLLRLLRMLKVMTVMTELHDMIHSEALLTTLSVLQFIVGILLLNHFLACGWYLVGNANKTPEPSSSWVARLEQVSGPQGVDDTYLYTTALHWSLTQFTPASMEVVPCNSYERIYTVGVLLFACILFSSLLSSITTSMMNLRKQSSEKRRQMGFVRRYITDKHVTLDLGNRISGFLRQHNYNVNQRSSLHEDQIMAFRILPESLRTQLRCEVFLPRLINHPMFRLLHDTDESVVINLCTTVTSEEDLNTGLEKFAGGTRAEFMYVLIRGSLNYFRQGEEEAVKVGLGTHICEPALWVAWEHKGRLVATGLSELVGVRANEFATIVSSRIGTWAMCRCYAVWYHQWVRTVETDLPESLSDLTECWAMVEDFARHAGETFHQSIDCTLEEIEDMANLFDTEGRPAPARDSRRSSTLASAASLGFLEMSMLSRWVRSTVSSIRERTSTHSGAQA